MNDAEVPCEHQLIFAPSLEHAATCARCGAIALIAPHDANDGAARIDWAVADVSIRNDSASATEISD